MEAKMARKKTSDNVTGNILFLVLCCFFLSGLSGLIYEILWMRMIIKIIGSAPFAVSIILTIFMGGLGLGSYLAGRVIDRISEPLSLVRIYGILELVIGLYAIVIPVVLLAFKPLQTVLYNGLYNRFIVYNLLTFILCSVILLIPVTCMGATLPILCRFCVARLSHLGTHAGRLYGLNTIGAALGALLCGFWLIDFLGVSGTLVFAVLINIMIGLTCITVSYKAKVSYASEAQKTSGSKKTPQEDEVGERQLGHPSETKCALVIFVVSGFCAMACEVIWTRLLGLIVGPTTYSFTIVLVTFITGLALGSMIFGYFADKVKNSVGLLLFTQVAAALLVLAVSQFLGTSQMFFAKLIFTFKDQFGLLSLVKAAILFMFMLFPTLCFGATFPLVGKIYTKAVSEVGRSIGFAYMLNSVGSLLGAFCAGFLLIPLVGKELSVGIVVSLQLITSVGIAGIMLKNKKEGQVPFALLTVPALAGLVLCLHYPTWSHRQLSIGKYHRFETIRPEIASTGWLASLFHGPDILSGSEDGELTYYGEGIGGFTTVTKYTDAFGNIQVSMANSGKPDASTHGDMTTQTLSAHFPMLFHKNPKAVMVLGLASGITGGEVLCYPVEQLDILEISDQVVKASDLFVPWNNKVLSNPRTNLIIQDGRAHLQLSEKTYDVITSEPSNPWMAGIAALFTEQFMKLARSRLNDDGIFVQWIHSYQMDWESFSLVGRTFGRVFPNSLLVVTNPSGQGIDYLLVGFKGKDELSLEYAEQKLVHASKSKNVTITHPRLLYRLIVSENLQGLFGQGNINTDSRPRLEYAAPKLMYDDDQQISKKLQLGKQMGLSSETKNIIQQLEASVDDQIDFATYAFSLFAPFPAMVDLSSATPIQRDRFFKVAEGYCADNEVDCSIFEDNELKERCLSLQIDIIQKKLDLLPNRLRSYSYLACLYNIAGRTSEAIKYYTEVLRTEPSFVEAHKDLGNVLTKEGRLAEAIIHYSEALRIDPWDGHTHHSLGAALAKQGRFAEAIGHYSEALRIDPRLVEAHNGLGIVLGDLGRITEAVNHYSEALRINPNYAKAHNNLANALAKQGKTDEAIRHYSEALRINPNYAKAHNGLGAALARRGDIETAVSHFREALRIQPGYPQAHNNLKRALTSQAE